MEQKNIFVTRHAIDWRDGFRIGRGITCVLLGKKYQGLGEHITPMLQVQFPDGTIRLVYPEDLEERENIE